MLEAIIRNMRALPAALLRRQSSSDGEWLQPATDARIRAEAITCTNRRRAKSTPSRSFS